MVADGSPLPCGMQMTLRYETIRWIRRDGDRECVFYVCGDGGNTTEHEKERNRDCTKSICGEGCLWIGMCMMVCENGEELGRENVMGVYVKDRCMGLEWKKSYGLVG